MSTSESDEQPFTKLVREYADKRITSLTQNIDRSRRYFAVEGIHDLRVDIKKLRALYDLVKVIAPTFNAEKHRRPLRKLFKKAGQLRDIDIQQALVLRAMKSCDLSEFYNRLKGQELLLRPGLVEACDDFDSSALQSAVTAMEAALAKHTTRVIAGRIERDIERVLGRIKILTAKKNQTRHSLHEIRKLVKRARYTLDVWKPAFKSKQSVKRITTHLKSVADTLGEWHDTEVLIESMSSYLEHDAPEILFDKSAYNRFLKQLQQRSKLRLQQYDQQRKRTRIGIPALNPKIYQ